MTKSKQIRPLVRADLPSLEQVIESTDLFPPAMLNGMAEPYLSGSKELVLWLTYRNPDPVALAYAAPEAMSVGTWNLYLLAVHKEHQGQGIGRALVDYVEGCLATEGQRLLLIETSGLEAFDRTRSFYRQCGYEEEARIRDFYDSGDDKVIFRKAL